MGFRSKPPTPEEMKAKREKARARKSARALKRVQKLAAEIGEDASEWEAEFLESLDARLDKFGAAFRDFEKGTPGEALSRLQQQKLKEIAAKAKEAREGGASADERSEPPAPRPILKKRLQPVTPSNGLKEAPRELRSASQASEPPSEPAARPRFQVIDGGKD